MKNLPKNMVPDHDNQIYYDTELKKFYMISWEKSYYDIPTRIYIDKL